MKKLDKKRRREGKTNYHRRLILLKSMSLRLIVRKTNKYLILQIVESKRSQDKILIAVSTKELLKYGWPKEKTGGLKSLGAAYLAGLLIGKKSSEDRTAILDIGLIPSTKGSRVYAAVKGFSDAGGNINYNDKVVPVQEKIEKEEFFNKVKEDILK